MSMIGNFVATTDEQIAALLADPAGIEALLYPEDDVPPRHLTIDKAWQGIHFLLNGDPWSGDPPLDFIVSGGESIGDVDVGYGPARALTSAQVREAADALAPMTVETLFEAWDPDALRAAEIYAIDPSDRESELQYIGQHFEPLKRYVAEAARDGLGLIVYMN